MLCYCIYVHRLGVLPLGRVFFSFVIDALLMIGVFYGFIFLVAPKYAVGTISTTWSVKATILKS
jgi:hypothetical protein